MCPMDRFRAKSGEFLQNTLLSQSYYESFEEKLADGQLSAETLARVLCISEEESQRSLKPEPSRQMGLHLDATLTIQTRSTTTEDLRDKYTMMSNMWLLAQLRQRGCTPHSDLTPHTLGDILKNSCRHGTSDWNEKSAELHS